jgi:pyruvate formate-lyase/glycerol dehydratase family glycyl radical enzyme
MSKTMLPDISLKDVHLTERVSELRKNYFRAMPEICIERPRLVTRFAIDNGLLNQDRISILDKARTYRYVLENRSPIVLHNRACEKDKREVELTTFELENSHLSLFAGSTTSKYKGVPMYPEFLALAFWPELETISKRARNPYGITDKEIDELNYDIFPHWLDNNIMELTRKRMLNNNGEKLDVRGKKDPPDITLLKRLVFFLTSKPYTISHTIPDFSRAIKEGLREIINDANKKKDKVTDNDKKEFYTAIAEVLEGIIAYSNRLADEAERLARNESNPVLKQELLEMAEVNRRVPEYPARTFREGLTTVWTCWIAIHLENPNIGLSLGRLDQILYEFYRLDIDKKTISIEEAVELVCCLWLKIGDHVPAIPDAAEKLFGGTGSNQAITIGGVDKEGKDAVNDLTYVMLRATELMLLRDPNLNARYYPGVNSDEYIRRLCDANIETKATPALHNDKAVIKALTSKGETIEQARDYGIVGCVEPGSNGRTYGHSASILLNLTSVLELTLFNGRHRHTGMNLLISEETGDAVSFKDFNEFKDAFAKQVRWMAEKTTNLNNIFGKTHQQFYPTPILSALFEGPMEKGKDIIEGGAAINFSGVTIIGFADVVDSLSAIQKVVFEEKEIAFRDLIYAVEKDFIGDKSLQARLMDPKKTPKYGNEDPAADANTAWLVDLLDKEFSGKQNYRGGHYRVGYWTMTIHAGYGRLTGALPSGRKAGENFASGITPVSGVTPYLTKALNSVAKLPAKSIPSGMALNLKFTPEVDKKKMLDNFVAYVKGYFDDNKGKRDGGMEIQFNITKREDFEDAVRNPEKYPELLVRVSGYTAYFKDLNPQMQKEIIDRTEYGLMTGEMITFGPFLIQKYDEQPSKVWVFQAIPKRYDLRTKMEANHIETWLVTRYREEMSKGDVVYFWLAGDETTRGIYGWGKIVSSEARYYPDWGYGIDVKYEKVYEHHIPSSKLGEYSALTTHPLFRMPIGTNFKLTKQQNEVIKYAIKELLSSFKITESSLNNLKKEGIPNEVLKKLESMKNLEPMGEKEFVDNLEKAIGRQQTIRLKSLIAEYANLFDEEMIPNE